MNENLAPIGEIRRGSLKTVELKQYWRKLIGFGLKNSAPIVILLDCLFIIGYLIWSHKGIVDFNILLEAGFILVLTWLLIGYLQHTYFSMVSEDAEVLIERLFYHTGFFFLVVFLLHFFYLEEVLTKHFLFWGAINFGGLLILSRLFFFSLRKRYRSLILKKHKVVIIDNNYSSEQLERFFNGGILDYSLFKKYDGNDIRLYADGENSHSDIYKMAKMGVSDIFCSLTALDKNSINQLITEADRNLIRVKFLADYSYFDKPVAIEHLGPVPLIAVRSEPLQLGRNQLLKRGFDIFFSLFVLIFVMSWLTPIIYLAIRLESRGPLFFKQKRSGLNNQIFYCYKFRSMVADNPTSDTVQAVRNDKRVTRVGAFLRRTSLDELPQFFNVLIGDMSVVGPRPHMLAHTQLYKQKIAQYMVRHFTKPGITGLAQIKGFRGTTSKLADMQKRVEADIDYIENWSFFLDMKIIFLTIWDVVKGDENAV